MKIKLIPILLTCTIMLTSTVSAATLPKFDVNDFCAKMTELAEGDMDVKKDCLEREKMSFQNLQKANVSENEIARCDDYIADQGKSYYVLEECLRSNNKAK